MKKAYVAPDLNVILLSKTDVIVTSTDGKQPSKDDAFIFSIDRYWNVN